MSLSSINLDVAGILEAASAQSGGLNDFGDLPFLQPLERVVSSLNDQAHLHKAGQYLAANRMIAHTANRLLYVNDRKKYPPIQNEKIVKPVFIIGMPRTGTTMLHDILAQDVASRVPLTWECMFPSPPPQKNTFATDPRIARCQATFPDTDTSFDVMHPMGATRSQECVMLMSEAMCTPLFHIQYRIPAYQDWVDQDANFADVYQFHKRQLQHFQWQCPGERWVLKAWAHMWGIEHLLMQYPDARIIFTHRDPVKSLASYASLTSHIRSLTSDDVDRVEIATDWTERLHRVLNHTIDVREQEISRDAKIYDMHFTHFIRDQFAEVEKIYQALDIELTGESADNMKRFIDQNPRDKHGRHQYKAKDHGIAIDETREKFDRYIEKFNVAIE